MKKLATIIAFSLILIGFLAKAQNVMISPSGISPAMSGTYPRLNYDAILALPSPQIGDIAYDVSFLCLRVFNGTKWVCTFQNPIDPSPNITAISTAGGTSYDYGSGIAVDGSGNVFITGFFNGTANFGGQSKTSAGLNDIFVAKYNTSGTLNWVQTAAGTSDDYGNGIAVDASGNVFITGYFSGTANFGGVSKTSVGGSYDIFVTKYNPSGTFQWVQTAGGTSFDIGKGIVVDVIGNVFITGFFAGTANFGLTTKTSVSGSYDIFVAKYNSTGTLEWVQTAGGTSTDYGIGITVDVNGNVLITGYFSGTANFGGVSITSTSGSADIFVAKYDPVGVIWFWGRNAGGAAVDVGNGIAVDAIGNVFITGYFFGTANFGGESKASAGGADIFVAKYNTSGIIQWVQTAGGISDDSGNGIKVDVNGNVFITGYFFGTANFGTASKTSAGSADIFVAKYNSSGVEKWVQTAGGTSTDSGNGIGISANGNLFIIGNFYGTANFGAVSKASIGGDQDIFVARLQE